MTLSLAIVRDHLEIPTPVDDVDSELYQYAVATDAEKFFKSERARLLDGILSSHDSVFNKVEELLSNSTIQNKPQHSTLLTGKTFDFEVNISRPFAKFNKDILKQLLISETALSPADVNRLFKLSTESGSPRRTFKVLER